jgi:hypothetical protein
MFALIGPRLLHINLVCAIFYFFEYNNASKLRPASGGSLHSHDCFFVLMEETLLTTEQGELRMRCGTHRFVSLPLPITGPLIDTNMLGPSNAQALRVFV